MADFAARAAAAACSRDPATRRAARCSPGGHAAQQTQTWRDYNDAQRLWVVGSYFHFSAGAPAAAMVATDDERAQQLWGAGWRGLRGYDYFSDADDGSENNPIAKLAKEKEACGPQITMDLFGDAEVPGGRTEEDVDGVQVCGCVPA